MDPDVRRALDRILASRRFAGSPRLSGFLQFVVERTAAGAAGEIKESVIAAEVYGRGAGYDPQKDSLVRAEASRLRRVLDEYYAGEGAGEALRIEIPRGTYVPQITHRHSPTILPGGSQRKRLLWLLAAAGSVSLLIAGAWAIATAPAPSGPSPETVQLYLKAADMLESVYDRSLPAGSESPQLREAFELAEAVTRQSPAYAPGWAVLAKASYRIARADRARFDEWIARSRAAAERAVALDPEQAKAWTLLGRIRFFIDWDLDGAEKAYRKGIPLNLLDPESVPEYFDLLRFRGKHREAQAAVGALLGQAAQSYLLRVQQARLLIDLGRIEDAERLAETGLSSGKPGAWMHLVKARCALKRQDRVSARAHLETALALEPGHRSCLHMLGMIYAGSGERDKAEQILRQLEPLPARGTNVEYSMAVIWMMLGDEAKSLQWLGEGLKFRDPALAYFREAVQDGEPWTPDFVESEGFKRLTSTYPAWAKLLQ
jgi:tetratricopeptide (TPR) repeat protein